MEVRKKAIQLDQQHQQQQLSLRKLCVVYGTAQDAVGDAPNLHSRLLANTRMSGSPLQKQGIDTRSNKFQTELFCMHDSVASAFCHGEHKGTFWVRKLDFLRKRQRLHQQKENAWFNESKHRWLLQATVAIEKASWAR